MASSSPSPSSRRSPRLSKHGLHQTPPSKPSPGRSGRRGAKEGVSSLEKATTTRARTTTDSTTTTTGGVMPFLATTPTQPSKRDRKVKTPVSMGKGSPKKVGAAAGGQQQHQRSARRTRRAVTISPRTRGNAIASILASPGEFAAAASAPDDGNNKGGRNKFLTPSKRSSAEATLNLLARATRTGSKRKLSASGSGEGGGDTLAQQRRKRRRKAASDASDKVRDICEMDDFDDLAGMNEKIPYNKPGHHGKSKKKGAVSDLVVGGETMQSVFASSSEEPKVTVDTFQPRNKIEERWFRNFKKWSTSQVKEGTNETASNMTPSPSSPLPKRWAQEQRAQYRLLQQDKKSQLTQDRIALLEGVGFRWELRNRKTATMKNAPKDDAQTNSAKVSAKAADTNDGGEKAKDVKAKRVDGNNAKAKPSASSAADGSKKSSSSGSPSKRKSPRKSPPTQFYHNLGPARDQHDEKVEGKAKSDTVRSSAGDAKKSVAEDSPSKRKSPRKSPPTQFYHNLDKKDGGASPKSTEASSAKRKLKMPDSPQATKPTTTSKGAKPSSPSRRSLAQSYTLASLSATTKSDKQKQGKKKKRRGRHSTSSLTALEVSSAETSTKSKSASAKKAPTSFSHEELKQELSKVKKKPARKKPEGGAAAKKKPTKKANQKASNGKKSTTTTSQKPSETKADGKVAEDKKSSLSAAEEETAAPPPSPQSPLRVTKLLPALEDGETEKKATQNEAMEKEPDVTKLLLSCLSEDSAEKEGQTSGTVEKLTSESAEIQPSNEPNDSPQNKEESPPSVPLELAVDEADTASAQDNLRPPNDEKPTSALPNDNSRKVLKSKSTEEPVQSNDDDTATEKDTEEAQEEVAATVKETPVQAMHAEDEEKSPDIPAEVSGQNEEQASPPNNSSQEMLESESTEESPHPEDNAATINEGEQGASSTPPEMNVEEDGNQPEDQVKVSEQNSDQHSSQEPTQWTCDLCKEATFESYDDAVEHEKQCAETTATAQADPPNAGGAAEHEASGTRVSNFNSLLSTMIEESEKVSRDDSDATKTKDQIVEPDIEQTDGWACDICKEATFQDYDEAVAHEKNCAGMKNSQAETVPDNRERKESELAEEGDSVPHVNESGTPNSKKSRRRRAPQSSLEMVSAITQSQSEPSPSRAKKPAAAVEPTVLEKGEPQSTPGQHEDNMEAEFSPLSLTSPLEGNDLHESIHHDANYSAQPLSIDTRIGTQFQLAGPANPPSLSLASTSVASQHANLSLAVPPGTQLRESQLQMMVAEQQYQARMAEFGRLELEAKMVTQRMREIEQRIQGIDSNNASNENIMSRQDDIALGGYESVSRKRSYRSESKSSRSVRKSHSWSHHHYESSEEEYHDEYHSPRKRRKRYTSNDDVVDRMPSRRSDSHERSEKSSRSSRHQSGRRSRSRYDDEEELGSARKQKRLDRRRVRREEFELPDRSNGMLDNNSYHTPDSKRKSRGSKSDQRPLSRSRKSPSKRNQGDYHDSEEDGPSPRKPAARQVNDGALTEEFPPHFRMQLSQEKSRRQNVAGSKPKSPARKESAQSEVEAVEAHPDKSSMEPQDGEGKDQGSASATKNDTDDKQSSQQKDPLHWLAGGENSSDEESWDFDGPMILPPPPI